MSAFIGTRLDPTDLISLISARDSNNINSTSLTTDAINGGNWTATAATFKKVEGIPCFDNRPENPSTTTYTGNTVTFGQYYTLFYHCKPTSIISSWRTFHRNSDDHLIIGESGSNNLGMYSNRNGGFRDSGYDLISDKWQTIIVTGEGDSSISSTGTTTIYIDGKSVGTCDRVGCGTSLWYMNIDSQSLGYWSIAGVYGKLLTPAQIKQLHTQIQLK